MSLFAAGPIRLIGSCHDEMERSSFNSHLPNPPPWSRQVNKSRALHRSAVLLGAAVILTVGPGCGRRVASESTAKMTYQGDGPIQAVATVGMVADLVRHVGGSRVAVRQIMGAGVDPHLYKATRDDVRSLMQSDVIFYCGLMLEGKMSDTLVKVGRDKPVFAVTELIDTSRLLEPDGAEGHFDPHVWMDVAAWSTCVSAVAEGAGRVRPATRRRVSSECQELPGRVGRPARLRREVHRFHS